MNILCFLQIKDKDSPTGCEYYRQLVPHFALSEQGFKVTNTNTIKGLSDEDLLKFDAVHIIRKDFADNIPRLKKLGIPVIFDIDDYWQLYTGHPLLHQWKEQGYADNVFKCLKEADVVTCSTNYLADKIKPFRPDVMVIPNCIEPTHEQFKVTPKPLGEKIRFGWIGGSMHLKDLDCIMESMKKVWADNEINQRIEFVLGGWVEGSAIHRRFLQVVSGDFNPNAKDNIILKKATNALSFATMYDECDVMLAPLAINDFNRAKSQLKVVEAGWKGKAVIATDIEPYNTFQNLVLIEERKNHKDWYKAIKRMVQNPDVIIHLQEELYREVHEQYDINQHIWKLKGLYQNIKSLNSSTLTS